MSNTILVAKDGPMKIGDKKMIIHLGDFMD